MGFNDTDAGSPATVTNGYWDKESAGQTTSAGSADAAGLTTVNMYVTGSFTGFDFTDATGAWYAPSNTSGMEAFPRLRNMKNVQLADADNAIAKRVGDANFNLMTAGVITYRSPVSFAGATMTFASSNDAVATVNASTGEVSIVSAGNTTFTITRPGNADYLPVSFKVSMTVVPFLVGDGTEEAPYHITSIEQLNAIRDNRRQGGANLLSLHYILMNDLDFEDTDPNTDGKQPYVYGSPDRGWLPIGHDTENQSNFQGTAFTGSFRGHSRVIRNLFINRANTDFIGLFGELSGGARIDSLGLEDVKIASGDAGIGALAGRMNDAVVSHCYSSGVVSGDLTIGGLVGQIGHENDVLKNSYSACVVASNTNGIGGLVGFQQKGDIIDSYATGEVYGARSVGGLVGTFNVNPSIINSYSTAKVTGTGDNVGGFIGLRDGGTITNSYWNTEVAGVSSGVGTGSTNGTTARTTLEMYEELTGFDFTEATGAWTRVTTTDQRTFPLLRGMKNAQTLSASSVVGFVGQTFPLMSHNFDSPEDFTGAVVTYASSNEAVATISTEGMVTVEDMLGTTTFTITRTGPGYLPATLTVNLEVSPFSGEGTESDPFQITNLNQLNLIRNNISKGGANLLLFHYRLMNDLDFKDADATMPGEQPYVYAEPGKGWQPIGDDATPFTGNFDGRGFVIRNLLVNRGGEDKVGLLGT